MSAVNTIDGRLDILNMTIAAFHFGYPAFPNYIFLVTDKVIISHLERLVNKVKKWLFYRYPCENAHF